MALVSGSRNTPVWCMIYDDLEYTEEAEIFANQQKFVRSLTPYEIFIANIEAGNDNELLIKSLVESYGLFISGTKIQGGICAVSTLCYIFDRHGYHTLDRVLRLCIGAWEGDIDSLSANMLKAVMHLVATFGDDLRDDLFKEKVGIISVRAIVRAAKELRVGSIGYATAMLNYYNKKMKYQLKPEYLYSKKYKPVDDNFTEDDNSFNIETEEFNDDAVDNVDSDNE